MEQFPEQASTNWIMATFIYTLGAVAVLLVVAGLVFIDKGLVRRRNVLDTTIQKIGAAMVGGLGTLLIGYPIWQWQFNQAFGVPQPFWQAVQDWWLGGAFTTTASRHIDPAALPEADVLQIFLVFFVTFTMATMALIHTGVVERIKPLPLYVMSFVVGAVLSPLVGYLCWGSLSPLTLRGTHDFDGIFPLYITAGTFVLVLAWRVGPRLGAFRPHPSGARPASHNAAFVGVGVLLILFALPFITIGSGYIVPDVGFFGISFTESGLGIVIVNLFASILGGAVVGLVLAHLRREPSWALLGPIAGVVMGGTLFDIGTAWACLLVGGLGPLVALGTAALLRKAQIDDPKVVPLALGPGILGALLTGFIEWGTPTGGYIGLEGQYAVGVGEITPWWQLAGVVATMLVAGVPALLMCLFFERFGGLRVDEEAELTGLDAAQWGVSNFADDLDPAAAPASSVIPPSRQAPEGTPTGGGLPV
ncbi:ammonium transporter [Geodermatophilus sabuli]|uniref:Ammonia channel protein AmtB n=1 Tax=Geodermatophilus sabuli TaxID=1564158 RepID=A0A285EMI9_9ACTN|nr:ammonium transporter [Geodermatophilus sabuli]MBB3087059.1 ammonia channel protein AmtB [Geodermatophilus sabuli]SNX99394.1 Ammonia channel protein AmtB [Geodermatophilus sabuli]